MPRTASSLNAAALAGVQCAVCEMGELDFASGSVYANNGQFDIVFGGNTYLALGDFAGISGIGEGVDLITRGVKVTLAGGTASLLATAQNEVYQNRNITLYQAVFNAQTGQLIDTPEILWEGRMDTMSINADQGAASITLNCESRLRREPKDARFTDVDQQQLHPGDTFFSLQWQIQNFSSQWGQNPMQFAVFAPGTNNGGAFNRHNQP